KKADLILINVDRPEWVPTYNYVYSLVYTASGDSVETSIVDGRILMEDRRLTTIDLGEVHARCRELAPKLAARANVKPSSRWPVCGGRVIAAIVTALPAGGNQSATGLRPDGGDTPVKISSSPATWNNLRSSPRKTPASNAV